MTPPHMTRITLSLTAAILLLLPTSAVAKSPEEIYFWVAEEMGISVDPVLPEVHFVTKEYLGQALRHTSRASFKAWEVEYGAERAESFMETYTTGVVGLYDVQNNVVYVGNFLEGCRREAILAHEFVHALQLATEGPVGDSGPAVALVQMFREQEASSIERRYAARCSQGMIP